MISPDASAQTASTHVIGTTEYSPDFRPHWFELGYDGYSAEQVDQFLYALGDAVAAGANKADLAVAVRDTDFDMVQNGYDLAIVDTYMAALQDKLAGDVIVL